MAAQPAGVTRMGHFRCSAMSPVSAIAKITPWVRSVTRVNGGSLVFLMQNAKTVDAMKLALTILHGVSALQASVPVSLA